MSLVIFSVTYIHSAASVFPPNEYDHISPFSSFRNYVYSFQFVKINMILSSPFSAAWTAPTPPARKARNELHRTLFSKSNNVSDLKSNKFVASGKTRCRSCEYFDLHNELIPYAEAWSWQKSIVKEKMALVSRNDECSDSVIVLQHKPVYTLGTGSSETHLNFNLKKAPFDVYRTERGGEVTYHGPGQLVMYPIINLRKHKMDLHWYLRALEEVVIRVLSSTFSIKASRVSGLTGVWVGDKKLAAVGIRASQWITYHGLALNVNADLTPFRWIVPCGIRNRGVGNIVDEFQTKSETVGENALLDVTCKALLQEFSQVFQVELHYSHITPSQIMKTAQQFDEQLKL